MDVPIRFIDSERVAPDTYVIGQLAGEGMGPTADLERMLAAIAVPA
jgi:hypothetical protein